MKKIKKIPLFKSEDEEREFWLTHSPLDYLEDVTPVKLNFPNLKPSTKMTTIKIPESLVVSLKVIASKKDVSYQSLVQMFLNEKVKEFTLHVKHTQ